jgi:hypothetical protein
MSNHTEPATPVTLAEIDAAVNAARGKSCDKHGTAGCSVCATDEAEALAARLEGFDASRELRVEAAALIRQQAQQIEAIRELCEEAEELSGRFHALVSVYKLEAALAEKQPSEHRICDGAPCVCD